jgi:hypothetical protein
LANPIIFWDIDFIFDGIVTSYQDARDNHIRIAQGFFTILMQTVSRFTVVAMSKNLTNDLAREVQTFRLGVDQSKVGSA